MDFKDQIKQLAARILKMKDQVKTEEATKNAFIMPFIQCLGYDVFNPLEVVPEFTADFGIRQGEKVDYVILKEGNPTILIECKCHTSKLDIHNSQLFRYFSTTSAKFSLLTNGIEFRFYTDLVETNKMDMKPFFKFDITDIRDNQIDELKKFHKTYFNLETITTSASDLKYMNELRTMIQNEIDNPSHDFVTFFARRITYPNRVTERVTEQFTPLLRKSFTQYINDIITDRLKSALQTESEKQAEIKDDDTDNSEPKIITTDEELEAFYIVKSILRPHISIDRIFIRDNQTYCSIICDNNNRKPIIRFYFNSAKKSITFLNMDEEKGRKEIRHEIASLNDIYNYSKELITATKPYIDE